MKIKKFFEGNIMYLPKGLRYSFLMFTNILSETSSSFKRLPEPQNVTDGKDFVDDYNRAADSIMMLPYVLVLQTLQKILGKKEIHKAVDFCCGPGHFTRLLAKQDNVKEVIGVDLSAPMLAYARGNAEKENLLSKMHFLESDVSNIQSIESQSIDVVTFLNGAHHFDSLQNVRTVLVEAERMVKQDGIILVLDPVRQKTKEISDLYYRISGEDYVKKGMSYFNIDFYNSILASWRPEEFIDVVPRNSTKDWVQIVPFGVPSFQMLIGLPPGTRKIFSHDGPSSHVIKSLIPKESLMDWRMFSLTFRFSKIKWINHRSSDS